MDGDFLQRYTSLQLEEGDFVKVPTLSGTVSQEGTLFCSIEVNTTAQFFDAITSWQNFPAVPKSVGEKILELYPDNSTTDGIATLSDSHPPGYPWGVQFALVANYYGDGLMTAGRRQACQTWAQLGVPAYCFRFNALTANTNAYYGVEHGSDIPFVFLDLDGVGYAPLSKNPFSGLGQSYTDHAYFVSSNWASFVSDLDPNAWRTGYKGKEAVWPEYSTGESLLVFDANVT